MDSIVGVVNSLENKIVLLLQKLDEVTELNKQLSEELENAQKKQNKLHEAIEEWEDKYNTLKIAGSMLGSTSDNNEAKLKINTLIREIDQCIVQLSE
ncbi:hypothetical protein NBRC110019_31030 [Neptunitalea chrysea]|uniref:Cell division protein ZapB n=1 Tax=Neptunitalea chrysea TaxID=1647581 RepID=A0A9W6B8M4_9FLAO|nr:hypothetical protein [Neptunitalea chrysea]GLB54062.1 hypothetical protein NBRC110019_31030 [Neptunitalea chrysea]